MRLDPDASAVLGLSARGLNAAEVADQLGVSLDHVRGRLADALAALGASSKLEAVIRALDAGLIDLDAAVPGTIRPATSPIRAAGSAHVARSAGSPDARLPKARPDAN